MQDPEVKNAELSCRVLELETELKQTRETAFERLSENVEMRNRRGRLKRDVQTANARVAELEALQDQADARRDDALKEMEQTLLLVREELASERQKNAGLKDLVVRVTNQRDDALAKLAGIRRMSSPKSPHMVSLFQPLNVAASLTPLLLLAQELSAPGSSQLGRASSVRSVKQMELEVALTVGYPCIGIQKFLLTQSFRLPSNERHLIQKLLWGARALPVEPSTSSTIRWMHPPTQTKVPSVILFHPVCKVQSDPSLTA